MANFVITGKAEQADESSCAIQSTGEVVTKIQLTLNVPGMNDRVLCEMPLDVSPKPDMLEQWEMEESWLVVSANTMRALGFTSSNARPVKRWSTRCSYVHTHPQCPLAQQSVCHRPKGRRRAREDAG
jgi:hypothetical protein